MKTLEKPPQANRPAKVESLLDELDTLIEENREEKERLSLYVPAGKLPNEVPESRIQLKNALDEARTMMTGETGDSILRNVEEKLGGFALPASEEREFWQNQAGGLAVFADEDEVRTLRVPKHFESRVVYSNNWFLTPLLELAANVDGYWLLALSQNRVRLYRGSRLGIREIDLSTDTLSFEESETAAMKSPGDDPDWIEAEPNKENLERFFGEIEPAVTRAIGRSSDPLILAGVQFYLPLYGAVNTYRNLSKEMIEGNCEHTPEIELHERASKALRSEFLESRKEELIRLRDLIEGGKGVAGLKDVLAAAATGRVDSLVAPSDTVRWGTIGNEAEGTFRESEEELKGKCDLYQKLSEITLHKGGTLFYVESSQMPGGHDVCATLRY